jgi:hypothetical protein
MTEKYLEGYVEVAERIERFYEKYPDGSLQSTWQIVQIDGRDTIVVKAYAYRTPDDRRPGIGHASEPLPGLTPYTKNSELMVGETSAWGRAIAALGFEVKRGIASANEVRSAEANAPRKVLAMSAKQRGFLENLIKPQLDDQDVLLVMDWAGQVLIGGRGGSGSEAIDGLKKNPEETASRLLAAAQAWQAKQTQIPLDDADLAPAMAELNV